MNTQLQAIPQTEEQKKIAQKIRLLEEQNRKTEFYDANGVQLFPKISDDGSDVKYYYDIGSFTKEYSGIILSNPVGAQKNDGIKTQTILIGGVAAIAVLYFLMRK